MYDQLGDLAFNFGYECAYRDRPIAQDVGVDAGAMREFFHYSGPSELLKVSAGFAKFDAITFDIPDAKSLSYEIIEAHSRNGELAACGSLFEADLVHGLLFDESQRFTRSGTLGVEMPVAHQTFPRDSQNRVNRTQRAALDFAYVNCDDGHSVKVLKGRSFHEGTSPENGLRLPDVELPRSRGAASVLRDNHHCFVVGLDLSRVAS